MSNDVSPDPTSPDQPGSSPLAGKFVVLAVSGGIAAYKAIEVCRRLVDAGAHVAPILTESAKRFVGEVTFTALASEEVHTSLWDDASPIPHTRLGQHADLIIVAPATAKTIAAYTIGYSDDLLVSTLLATRAPVIVCPAMHTEMWEQPSVQDNLALLGDRGVHIVPPEEGRLAGGDSGAGRLAAPEVIVKAAESVLGESSDAESMGGMHVVVTAGGTREAIDPVRFIGNRSTGKQGYAFAAEAAARGARVTLVTTVGLATPAGAERVDVTTAQEMHDAVMDHRNADVIVMAAAVADFRPAERADSKIKKGDGVPTISLERTVDILAALGADKPAGQTLVGFAAETDDLIANASSKLARKGADFIVANDVSAPGVGFGHDTTAVTILSADGGADSVSLASKRDVARAVLTKVMAARQQHVGG